ncbi:MAG: NAD(P)/FAD-dependent oxidoreductase [Myxococcaceae bacterium]|nr:NAD(P)/FAD-dependent oxidoreductase [Myxococcaceae bacterium]
MTTAQRFDVVVIGGGHNGLVTAGLLAKQGFSVCVLERREVVGGAAVTETPFGPDYKVTALSYVVSLLPPAVVSALELPRFGYHVYPQHGYFAPAADGTALQVPADAARRHAELSRYSPSDADAMVRWDAWLGRLGAILGPLLTTVPPKLGSKRPGDLLDLASLAWRLKALDVGQVGDVTKLFTASVADLLEDWFEHPRVRGVMGVSGIIGTWAGPRSPGTAYVLAHHKLGDLGHGHAGAWGFPRGGMGGVTQAMRQACEALGVVVKTNAAVDRILVTDGRAMGVALECGDEFDADTVVATCHPQLAFLRLVERRHLPGDFVRAIETWRSRSGTVKVNVAVDRLPTFTARPRFDPEVHGGTIVLSESLDDLEGAFQDAAAGRAAAKPFADICIPSVFDPTLAPEGKHVVSMFAQWVPHTWAAAPDRAGLEAFADRVVARVEAVAPGFTSSVLHRQVLGPHEMARDYGLVGGNIFHGELSLSQLFHLRPAAGFSDFRTPIRGLYLASSATHGGGGVTGLPALQVVRAVVEDR